MGFGTLEDQTASAELVLFPEVYQNYASILKKEEPVLIEGTVSVKEEEAPSILVTRIVAASSLPRSKPVKTLFIKIPSQTDARIQPLLELVKKRPGQTEVKVYFSDEQKYRYLREIPNLRWTNRRERSWKHCFPGKNWYTGKRLKTL